MSEALTLVQIKPLAEALKASFYADPEQMRAAEPPVP
jgi:hypothetical protein